MRIFHISDDHFSELSQLPENKPSAGYLWVGTTRQELEGQINALQAALQRWTGGQLVDLHVADLLNNQLPSHFDYTSWYDILVFRRLAPGLIDTNKQLQGDSQDPLKPVRTALDRIDTNPVGFAVFDSVLLTVHPIDCKVREFFANKLMQLKESGDTRAAGRMPTSPADLMLRMVNHIVDSYLDLRRLLSKQLSHLQQELFSPKGHFNNWQMLLDSRNSLHLLEDTCEDQRSAITEWIDGLDELPDEVAPDAQRDRELLRVRSRDVLEHIERVLGHVRRLESSAETAVQMHFSAQSNRTNNIMRTLTVLTAIFLPLNLITGFFGMNFDRMPLTHSPTGLWIIAGLLVLLAIGLSLFFWRKRYLETSR